MKNPHYLRNNCANSTDEYIGKFHVKTNVLKAAAPISEFSRQWLVFEIMEI